MKHKYKVGLVLKVSTNENRQYKRRITKGTLCKIMRQDSYITAEGQLNYMVHFLPKNKYRNINKDGPFLFESQMEHISKIGSILFDK